jgi:hypothetical protein
VSGLACDWRDPDGTWTVELNTGSRWELAEVPGIGTLRMSEEPGALAMQEIATVLDVSIDCLRAARVGLEVQS